MRIIKYLLVLLIILCEKTQAQSVYPASTIPAGLKQRANAVIRDMETTIDMRAADQVVISVKKVVTVLNKNGDGSLHIFYNKNAVIKSIKGEIYDEYGKQVGKVSQAQFKDESAISKYSLFEDDRIKYFEPAMVSYPYTVIYDYELRNKQNLLIPDWYPQREADLAVESNRFRFICKPGDEVNMKPVNMKEEVKKVSDEKRNTYTWEVKQLPAFRDEPYSPPFTHYMPHVKIAPVKFSYYNTSGEYRNWKELGAWMYKDLIENKQALPALTIQKMKELVQGIPDQKAQAKKIYEYVQQKTRYISVQVGIGGFQPAPAAEVDALGYGDCKGLVNYMQSLLKAVGIPSYYCIVYAGSEKRSLDPEFASMNQANHVILCLPLEKENIWLECTSQTAPFGFLGDFTDDRLVLACTEDGGKILKTPELKTPGNLTIRNVSLQMNSEGSMQGKMQTVAKGAQYDEDEHFNTQSPDDQLRSLKEKYEVDNINFSNLQITQLKGDTPSTSIHFDLNIKNYVSKTQNRAYMVLNPFNKLGSIKEVMNRTRNVYINRGFADEDEIRYQLPDNFSLEAKPDDITIKNEFGTYNLKILIKGTDLIYSRQLMINSGLYKPEQYAEFVAFVTEISKYDQAKAVFKLKSGG